MSDQPPPPYPGANPPPPPYQQGYGAPPGPPPGYGAPWPGQPQPGNQYDVADAWKWAWSRFQQNVPTFVVPALIMFVLVAAFEAVDITTQLSGMRSHRTCDGSGFCYTTFGGPGISTVLTLYGIGLVMGIVNALLEAGMLRAALGLARDETVSLGTVFSLTRFGPILVAIIAVQVGTILGALLCLVPGLAFAVFATFTRCFVFDQRQGPFAAIGSSFALVRDNFGSALLFWLTTVLAGIVGVLACGVGVILAWPLVQLATAYTYRRLRGEAVPA